MAVANPRHATLLSGRAVPLFSEARAPLKNAFAAVAARATPDTAGFLAAVSFPAFIFRINIQSALVPTAFATATAGLISGTAGFLATIFLAFLLLSNINSAPPATNDACTDVRCERSSNFAVPSHARRFALRAPRWRKRRGDSLSSRLCTVSVISLSVCRICSRSRYAAVDCCSLTLTFSPMLPSPSDFPSFVQVSFPSASDLCALSGPERIRCR